MPSEMPVEKNIKDILDYVPSEDMVVTVYLAVDNARIQKQGYITKLNSMMVESKNEMEKDQTVDKNQRKSIYKAFEGIKDYVSEKFISNSTKTLLVYAKGGSIWKIVRLPVILRSKIIVDPKPHTQSLRNISNNEKRYAVLMIDREKAQIASIYLNEISDYLAAFISDVPSKVNFRGNAALREKKILGRIEEKLHHYFKYLDSQTLKLFKEKKFDNIILAGRKELLSQFKNYMHSYLQSKYIGDIVLDPSSPALEIQNKANGLIGKWEKANKDKIVDTLIDENNPNGWGVLGIDGVIKALLNDQIKTLVYDEGFKIGGYVCQGCRYMTTEEKSECPYCSAKISHYSDIVDEIIEQALEQGCEIISVKDNERLRLAGNIGAILRYKL